MELGNLYIYTGPEKMQCLTLAEGSFAKAFPVKAKANAKLCGCWQMKSSPGWEAQSGSGHI